MTESSLTIRTTTGRWVTGLVVHAASALCALSLSSCSPTDPSKAYVLVFSESLDPTHHPFEQLRSNVDHPIEWCPVQPDPRSQINSFSTWSLGSDRVTELKDIGNQAEANLCLFLDRGPDRKIVGCSVREIATGVLLADTVLDERDDAFSTKLAATTEGALARWSAPREDQTRIAFIVTSKMLDDAEAIYVDMFADLIERRLSVSSDVVVLPRLLIRSGLEPDRLPDIDVDAFVLLNLQGGDSGVRCVGSVQDSDNEVISTFEFQSRELNDNVAGDICRKVRQALNSAERSDSEWLPDLELKRRRLVAEAAGSAKNNELAIRSQEAALLLQPGFDSEIQVIDAVLKGLSHWMPLRRVFPTEGRPDLKLRWQPWERQQITLRAFQLGRKSTERIPGENLEQLMKLNQFPQSGARIYQQLQVLRNSSFEQPLLDRMWEDARVQMMHHVPTWQRLVFEDDTAAFQYHRFMSRHMQLLMWCWIDIGMERRIDEESRAAGPVEVAMLWLDYFDSLPEDKKPWRELMVMMRESTMLLGPDGPEFFAPLFQRMADHSSPIVQLYGIRGQKLGEFKISTPAIAIEASHMKEVRQRALAVLDDALTANDNQTKSAVIGFFHRTYDQVVAFNASPELVQEFADTCDALLDRGINPPSPMLEGLGRADGQLIEEEIRVLERVVEMFPTSKFKARLADARKQLEDRPSETAPE